MKNILQNIITSLVVTISFIISSCTLYEEPAPIESPNPEFAPSPVINGIIPPDSAIAGVREITLLGQNFAVNGNDTNWIYIGNQSAPIKGIEADRIVIYRPVISGELDIKVIVPSADGIGKITGYKIEEPVSEYGDFRFQAYPLTAVEVDNEENLYVGTRREIIKLASNGIDITPFAEGLSSAFAEITDLKFGPENYLYILTNDREVYRIPSQGGSVETYLQMPSRVEKFDFDENGNIYLGRRDGLLIVKSDKSVINSGHYDNIPAVEIRVFNKEVYWAATKTLYKNQIIDNNGSIGEDQVVIDLNALDEFRNYEIGSFNFAEDGTILICIKRHPKYSIFVLENGSLTPFYTADILPQSVDNIIWGSSRYIYLNRGSLSRDSTRMYRMGMDKLGAPYHGRQ